MPKSVRILAPSRIHFGLLSIEKSQSPYFGGVGAMLDQPRLDVEVSHAESSASSFSGPFKDRVQEFVSLWQAATNVTEPVCCEVLHAPPQHVGLGLGTQLGLSIAAALNSLFERDIRIEELARSVGRGRRSAVGAWGFERGGLVVDGGKSNDEELGHLRHHIELPAEWCVVLLRPDHPHGLAGNAEVQAFGQLPPAPDELKRRIRCELFDRMVPAATQGDFPSFAESVYEYGYAAGEMFASEQGGPFRSALVAEMVTYVRALGVPGVGQSSWGPTLFCWFPNRDSAESFAAEAQQDPNLPSEVIVSSVARQGAQTFVTHE